MYHTFVLIRIVQLSSYLCIGGAFIEMRMRSVRVDFVGNIFVYIFKSDAHHRETSSKYVTLASWFMVSTLARPLLYRISVQLILSRFMILFAKVAQHSRVLEFRIFLYWRFLLVFRKEFNNFLHPRDILEYSTTACPQFHRRRRDNIVQEW